MSSIFIPVTVIIPCYQSHDTIERSLNSVLTQSVLPAEIILVDDASDDGTAQKLRSLQHQFPIANITVDVLSKNGGPGMARNRAWELATQPWLAFLDADDTWHPHKLEIQWNWICLHPDAILVGHQTRELSALSSDTIQHDLLSAVQAKKISFLSMAISNRVYTRTAMLRKEVPYRFKDRSYTEDYLLWLEIILSNHAVYVLNTVLAFTHRSEFSPQGYSGKLWLHEKRELFSWYYLYQQKKISLAFLMLICLWSYLKYVRRVFRRIGR
jgi:glycosyltransferase involved in cell wall biosynthesis